MPSPEAIVEGLTDVANEWRTVAIGWHLLLAVLLLGLYAGWRPSNRRLGQLLSLPFVSVSVLAWMSRNPFNGTVFALLTVLLAAVASVGSGKIVQPASSALVWTGVLLVAFGSFYPHFLRTESWTTYAYAAPFGLLPCPTLSVVIGITLMCDLRHSRWWGAVLAVAGFTYGVIGVFRLGVALDYGLLAGATVLAGAVVRDSTMWRSVRADRHERLRRLPGDEFITEPLGVLHHAVTIRRPPCDVWPWLIQMGAGSRAGWYSYDWVDNGRRASATRIVPELQHVAVGTVFPALPGASDGFTVLALQPNRSLVIGWLLPDGTPLMTWAFVLEARRNDSTRLIVRARGGPGYRFHGLPWWLSKPLVTAVHCAMQRKQLLGIAQRAESSDVTRLVAPARDGISDTA